MKMQSLRGLSRRGRWFSSSSAPILSFDKYGTIDTDVSSTSATAKSVAVCFHGILGQKRNWKTPANVWLKKASSLYGGCVTFDHRGHGQSTSKELLSYAPQTTSSCAMDAERTFKHLGIDCPRIIFAHSFGGKVALQLLKHRFEQKMPLPKHTWILDSLPGKYSQEQDKRRTKDSIFKVLELVASLPKTFASKEGMINMLLEKGVERSVALWLATNIVPMDKSEGFTWIFSVEIIMSLFHDFCDTDMWPFLNEWVSNNSQQQGESTIHFLRAGKNQMWSDDIINQFKSLEAKSFENNANKQSQKRFIRLHTMPDVGHWLHAENLNGMYDIILREGY